MPLQREFIWNICAAYAVKVVYDVITSHHKDLFFSPFLGSITFKYTFWCEINQWIQNDVHRKFYKNSIFPKMGNPHNMQLVNCRSVSTEEGPSQKIYFGLSLFISISMSNRLFFIILTIILTMLSITFRFIKTLHQVQSLFHPIFCWFTDCLLGDSKNGVHFWLI